jgi:uncharacterized protein YqhQ
MADFSKRFHDWFFNKQPEGCISVGGQAVMEGVMMQGTGVWPSRPQKRTGASPTRCAKSRRFPRNIPGWLADHPRHVSFINSLVGGMKF